MLSHRAKNYENLVCVKFFLFRGRGRADPRRQDQLVLMGCANAKIMKPWFEPNISLFLVRVRADPRRQDQLVPMGCANTKIVRPWFVPNIFPGGRVRADSRRQDQLAPLGCACAKNHEAFVCVKFVVFGAGNELIPDGRINSHQWAV